MKLKLVSMKLNPEHWARVSDIAHERGIAASGLIRMFMADLVKRQDRQKRQQQK